MTEVVIKLRRKFSSFQIINIYTESSTKISMCEQNDRDKNSLPVKEVFWVPTAAYQQIYSYQWLTEKDEFLHYRLRIFFSSFSVLYSWIRFLIS